MNEAQPTTSTTATDLASYQQFALEQQAQNNAWSAAQAQKQMDFQRELSNTAHQREVADLKSAGLNPILSVNSGASVPNGASGDTDTSAAANVGGILQQVLQAQSAREVAGMYNAATLAAASIAANASMYGSDMAYWNKDDHPGSVAELAAWELAKAGNGSHAPGSGSSPHDGYSGSGNGSNSSSGSGFGSGSKPTLAQQLVSAFKVTPSISGHGIASLAVASKDYGNSVKGSQSGFMSWLSKANSGLYNRYKFMIHPLSQRERQQAFITFYLHGSNAFVRYMDRLAGRGRMTSIESRFVNNVLPIIDKMK